MPRESIYSVSNIKGVAGLPFPEIDEWDEEANKVII